MTPTNRKSAAGRAGMLLFATPFALVGIGMLVLAVIPNLYDWVRMHSWVPVEAQLISAELKRHRGGKSTTFEVLAMYRYHYEGITYSGNRVGISEKSDNIGDWHAQVYARLRSAHPLQVWVNPHDPHEAIFDRELRWGKLGFYLIFVFVFGGAGMGLMWLALRKPLAIPAGVPLWQGNPAWRDNHIRSNAKTGVWATWIFTIFWNLVSSPILFFLPREWDKGNYAAFIALLFPLIGLGAFVFAMKQTLEWRRFGVTPLQLDPFPGSVGGDVGGSIHINQSLPRDAIAEVQLSCMHVYSSGGGKNQRTVRDVQWQDQQRVAVEPGFNGSVIKFRFATPESLPESEVKSMPYYEWTLDVNCKLPGVDLDRSYRIPVFKATSPRRSALQLSPMAPAASAAGMPTQGVQVTQTGDGLRLHFPMFRALGTGIFAVLIGALFVGLAWLFVFGEMKQPPPRIFPILFGLLGSLAMLGGLYNIGNSLTVVINALGIQVTRRVFGFGIAKHIPVTSIQAIGIATGMQSAQGSKSTLAYRVEVRTTAGKKITVAEGLRGASVAEQLAAQIAAACHFRRQN